MYLSRITLLPHAAQDPAFWAMFREAYATHQEVWRWAGGGPDAQRDFLYRVDETDTGLPQVLILGTRPARAPENLWRSESKIWAPRLEVGQRLGFTLRANAVVRHGAERHDVVLHAKKLAAAAGQPPGSEADRTQETGERWLRAQGAKRGFEAETVIVGGHHVVQMGRGSKAIRLGILDIEGALTVTEPDRFVAALTTGIGPAKGFGFGLMLVRPI